MHWPHIHIPDEVYDVVIDPADDTVRNYCDHVINTISIRDNGDVVPCCYDLTSQSVMGNVHEESLSAIWNNPPIRLCASLFTKKFIPLCDGCNVVKPNAFLHVKKTHFRTPDTSMTTLIVNYGMGNLGSVSRALEECGADVLVSENPDDLSSATHVVLPGVGAFRDGMTRLKQGGWVEPLTRFIITEKFPLLGICLGMQLLADIGHEGEKPKGWAGFRARWDDLILPQKKPGYRILDGTKCILNRSLPSCQESIQDTIFILSTPIILLPGTLRMPSPPHPIVVILSPLSKTKIF